MSASRLKAALGIGPAMSQKCQELTRGDGYNRLFRQSSLPVSLDEVLKIASSRNG
jgi:hypothetical protein